MKNNFDYYQKLNSYRRGLIGEYIARIIYFFKGYQFIMSRYRNHFGEIDLICHKNNSLIFIEVKTRSNPNYITEGIVSYKQINRIKKTAQYFIMESKFDNPSIRFDCVIIKRYLFPIIIENCW